MPSPFVDHLIKPLVLSQPPSLTSLPEFAPKTGNALINHAKRTLQSLLVSLNEPLSSILVNDVIGSLVQIEQVVAVSGADVEEDVLKYAIVSRLIVGLYAQTLDLCLSQATDAEAEAEWWDEIERSRRRIALYLLQTLPSRLVNLSSTILQALRTRNIPFSLSVLTSTSLHQLFPSADSHRPSVLTKALFPYLHHQRFSVSSSAVLFFPRESINRATNTLTKTFSNLGTLFSMPLELTRQECLYKRRELRKIRDQRAEVLGRVAQMRGDLASIMQERTWHLGSFAHSLECTIRGDSSISPQDGDEPKLSLRKIMTLSNAVFAQHATHQEYLDYRNLRRPAPLILLWPRLLLLPPLVLYASRCVYSSRASLAVVARDAKETVVGFLKGWLVEPLRDVLKTVRTGGEEGVIVRKEAVAADIDSLERMTLALATDELHYGPEQLASLSTQIRLGDLTPVLKLYEEDIKHPLQSAITGTLLRSVFIQIQKAKVDIDQTLTGIDKLLKSQELTFGFVGVAPAFAIIYLLGGSLVTMWTGGRSKWKHGGKRQIGGVWSAMRRTERLLISQAESNRGDLKPSTGLISPLTAGLLLLSVSRLRSYAETYLPARSRLREGFLEDVGDLENPDLGRAEKIRVIERMWRCWGEVLGWGRVGGESLSVR